VQPDTCLWRIVISPIIPRDSPSCDDSAMRDLVVLFIQFVATLARLLGPGGVRTLGFTIGEPRWITKKTSVTDAVTGPPTVWFINRLAPGRCRLGCLRACYTAAQKPHWRYGATVRHAALSRHFRAPEINDLSPNQQLTLGWSRLESDTYNAILNAILLCWIRSARAIDERFASAFILEPEIEAQISSTLESIERLEGYIDESAFVPAANQRRGFALADQTNRIFFFRDKSGCSPT
jgi:hypothetical protein